jgi:hypothetical protein
MLGRGRPVPARASKVASSGLPASDRGHHAPAWLHLQRRRPQRHRHHHGCCRLSSPRRRRRTDTTDSSASRPAEERVKRLVKALGEATTVIAAIEKEVSARRDVADRLQRDIARHRELLKLDRQEVEAVAQTLRIEMRQESQRSFLVSLAAAEEFKPNARCRDGLSSGCLECHRQATREWRSRNRDEENRLRRLTYRMRREALWLS